MDAYIFLQQPACLSLSNMFGVQGNAICNSIKLGREGKMVPADA